MIPTWRRIAQRVRHLAGRVRAVGCVRGLQIAYNALEGMAFDGYYGTDTCRRVGLAELALDPAAQAHGFKYDPAPISAVRRLLKRLDLGPGAVLVDVGSGKGRMLMVMAGLRVGRVVGVEFAAELCLIAQANLARYAARRPGLAPVQIIHGDATALPILPEYTLFFLFNPFDDTIMEKFIGNLRAAHAACPRTVRLVYYNPVHRAVIERSGAFLLEQDLETFGRRFLVYRMLTPARAT